MNIVIAAVSSNRSISGVSRHAANLAKCLLMRQEISSLHVLAAPWEQEYVRGAICRNDRRLRIHPVSLRPGTLRRNVWYYSALPSIAAQLRADVVHLAYPSPISSNAFPCPVVVTLHDLYPWDVPSNFGFPKVLLNRMILRQCLRNASAIACVSQTTRERLRVIRPDLEAKATTICNFAQNCPRPLKPSFAATWSDRPFLLCVAQHRRNKNVLLALRVFKRVLASRRIAPETQLVVVGLPGPESGKIHRFIRAANLSESVVFVDGIPDAELGWCYRNCELLLAPSSIEGFGLPVLEAQLAGCRVVCSDIPAFREVATGDCRFVHLSADAEERFAEEVAATLALRRPPPASVLGFSPATIAGQYLDLYRELVHLSEPAKKRGGCSRLAEACPESSSVAGAPSAAKP